MTKKYNKGSKNQNALELHGNDSHVSFLIFRLETVTLVGNVPVFFS